ncbi:RagB/SusD family nutrient uptake outer membrane protein [Gracilimonas sp.]|uniref:RagB/SusD family nutrient uptake outer membrane protein n=1 Tax=Gracilimonas sp. TaxID=1974203 RepID=UPI002870F4DF|nr:RagB/SusD family nutrient uptake outer membrane protein [Gracilimonas sp.]
MKKLILIPLLITVFVLHGCDDNLLDVEPKTEIGRENFFNSAADLQMYLNSMINWKNVMDMNHEQSDDATTTGSSEIRNMMVFDQTSRDFTSGWDWSELRNINYFLENFEKADIPQEALNHYEGVARFHRAKFYMNKIQRFGDVPWYDKVLGTDDEDLYKGRDSREYVIDKVFEDLEFAVEHVRSNSTVGAVNKDVVRTFMARYALFEGTFRKYHDYLGLNASATRFLQIARNQAKYIIDSGKYSIYKTGSADAYGSLFNSTNLQGNPEVILLNRSISGNRNSGWWAAGFGQYEQSHTKAIVQTYLMRDGSFYSSQPNYKENSFVEEFKDRDPRLSQSFAYPGWVINNTGTYAQGEAGSEYIQELNRNFTGYHTIKWFVNSSDATVQESVDVPVLRYAEILLIYAEASAELGEISQGILDITVNELRDRVNMPPLTMGVGRDQMLAERYPTVNDNVLLEIRRERRIELFNEDFRYLDVVRYGAGELFETVPKGPYFDGLGNHDLTGDGVPDIKLIGVDETIPSPDNREVNELGKKLTYYRAGPYGSDASVFLENGTSGAILAREDNGTFISPKHYYRPIPYDEVQLNTNLTQIFGWE